MAAAELNVVTGSFGYTGKYITRRLLEMGKRVITLTRRTEAQSPFGDAVTAYPFRFDRPDHLGSLLSEATTLYNTYWVRFPHKRTTYEQAVENSKALIATARAAGVRRIVHVSITNPSLDSPFGYFRGKAQLEETVKESGMSYAILRPAVIFGPEDILINNIAWHLRKFPFFAVPGTGDYRLQPIFVEDMARLAVEAGQAQQNSVIDAVGPEIFTFEELVRLVAQTIRRKPRIMHLAPGVTYALTRLVSLLVGDVVLTREEIQGLMADLLVSHGPPTGTTRLSEWLKQNAATVGARYASELKRHY